MACRFVVSRAVLRVAPVAVLTAPYVDYYIDPRVSIENQMVAIKLTYFDVRPAHALSQASTVTSVLSLPQVRGRAEPIRLAMVVGNIPFEDNRLSFPDFGQLKAQGKITPPGCCGTHNVPVMEVDGTPLTQSLAMFVFVGKLAKLYPDEPFAAAKVDEAIQYIGGDIGDGLIGPTLFMPEEEKAKARAKLSTETLPPKLKVLDDILATSESGFLVGDSLTIADLHLFYTSMWIGTLDGIPAEVLGAFPHINKHAAKVGEFPAIKERYGK